jgi:Ferritin-like
VAIDTREELINALHEASEIEHGLLVQYLYAGLSMKKGLSEQLTTHQQRQVRAWQARLFRTAREEMGHLGIVCNLLAAIGAPPKLHRPPMPRPTGYYPFPFDLIPFGDEALYRFLVFELPRGFPLPPPPGADLDEVERAAVAAGVAPEPLTFEFVGELYAKIAEGFRTIPESSLFIGPPSAQSGNTWSDRGLDIRVVNDRASALSALDNIIEDGEGTPDNRASSHYNGFLDIRRAYFREGRFAAARRVPRNPATRPNPRGDGAVTLIINPTSLRLAELFNASYGVMLLMLQHYFSLAPEAGSTDAARERRALQLASQRLMSVAVRPLAEQLTTQPLADPAAPERAGPSFEIYSEIAVSPYPTARRTILLERLAVLATECRDLGRAMPRVSEIGETLSIMREDLAANIGAP